MSRCLCAIVSVCYGQSERVRDLSTIASLQEELSDAHVAMARLSEQEKVLKDALRDTEDRYRPSTQRQRHTDRDGKAGDTDTERERQRETQTDRESTHTHHTKHTHTEQGSSRVASAAPRAPPPPLPPDPPLFCGP